jgi:uracil-DNA glycosylase
MELRENGEIFLTKPFQNSRNIGRVTIQDNKVVYKKEENEKDIYKKHNGWSINKTVLSVSDEIEYITEKIIYKTDRKTAYKNGIFTKETATVLDEKLVLPLIHWKKEYRDKSMAIAQSLLGDSWANLLKDEVSKDYFKDLGKFIRNERLNNRKIYPEPAYVFSAFHECSFESIRLVLIGNEPLKDSTGLAYSNFTEPCPVLRKFFKLVEDEIYDGFYLNKDCDLSRIADQGVLLLNRFLTNVLGSSDPVYAASNWLEFTSSVIVKISENKPGIPFIYLEEPAGNFLRSLSNVANLNLNIIGNPLKNKGVFKYLDSNLNPKIVW